MTAPDANAAFHPEDIARSAIDRQLAVCGWVVESRADMNVGVSQGVAVCEFQTDSGPVDYALFIDRRLRGVIEAKAEGVTLSALASRRNLYRGAPAYLRREKGQVRFEYVASAREVLLRDHADAEPVLASRLRVSSARTPFGPFDYPSPRRRGVAARPWSPPTRTNSGACRACKSWIGRCELGTQDGRGRGSGAASSVPNRDLPPVASIGDRGARSGATGTGNPGVPTNIARYWSDSVLSDRRLAQG